MLPPVLFLYLDYDVMLLTRGRVHNHLIAHLVAKHGFAEWGVLGEPALHGICLLRADYLICLLLLVAYELDSDLAAEGYCLGACLCVVDDDAVGKDILDLREF